MLANFDPIIVAPQMFAAHVPVEVDVKRKNGGRSKGFATIRFDGAEAAAAALGTLFVA
jgi:hypothetical protein